MKKKLFHVANLLVLSILLLIVYNYQLAAANEYIGYVDFDLTAKYILFWLCFVIITGLLIPLNLLKPSDYITFLYSIFILFPYAVLFPIRGFPELTYLTTNFLLLLMPVLFLKLFSLNRIPLSLPVFFSSQILINCIVLFAVICTIGALIVAPPSASFGIENMYERRIDGREIYTVGSLQAYMNAAVVNGFAPLVAFFSAYKKQPRFLIVAITIVLMYFYILGLKAPVLYVLIAYGLGVSYRKNKVSSIIRNIFIGLLILYSIAIVEIILTSYSYVADYFIRRAFSVPAWVISAYFEFMRNTSDDVWSLITGLNNSSVPITFVIGEQYLNLPGLNANTNAFVYSIGSGGLIKYIFTVILVFFIYLLLDIAYKKHQNPILAFLGFLYGLLIMEQAATTALVSSGLGFLIILFVFSKNYSSFSLKNKITKYRHL